MSKQTKKALVPTLRFPEFQDVGEWKNEPLEKLYSFKVTNSYSRDQLNYENGSVKNIHYGDIHTKFSTLFNIEKEIIPFINPAESLKKIKSECYCVEGDMIFADASEDLEDVGKSIEIVHINNEKLLSGLHTLLARQKNKKLIIGFGGYLFKSNRIRVQIKKEAQGAKVLGISAGRLSNIEVAFPSDKKEQQKIADCLSSIDELVTAQTQKLDALKVHKKGLMQQLFPAEGETVPKLRFPEFRDSWKCKVLGPFLESYSKRVPSNTEIPIYSSTREGLKPQKDYYDGRALINEGDYGVVPKGYFVYRHMSDDTIFKFNINDLEDHIAVSKEYPVFKTKGLNAYFLLQKLNSGLDFHQFAIMQKKGGTRTRLYYKTLCSWQTLLPSFQEQQKIADCLSSIDNLITAQTQKLDALKAHKKGLMQQLFPAVDEVAE